MRTKLIFITLLLIFLYLPSLSYAGQNYEYIIEDLKGEITEEKMTFIIPVNLGVSFEKINKVSIYLSGYATPGDATSTDGYDSYIEMPVSFQIKIADKFTQVTPAY